MYFIKLYDLPDLTRPVFPSDPLVNLARSSIRLAGTCTSDTRWPTRPTNRSDPPGQIQTMQYMYILYWDVVTAWLRMMPDIRKDMEPTRRSMAGSEAHCHTPINNRRDRSSAVTSLKQIIQNNSTLRKIFKFIYNILYLDFLYQRNVRKIN